MTNTTTVRRRTAAILASVLALSILTPAHAAKPNLGLYAKNYVMVVPSNANFLIHPTGEYRAYETKKDWKQVQYEPVFRETDDMDSFVLDMRDKGYVMIGYSAFGSNEADTALLDDYRAMNPAEQLGTRLGLRMRGIRINADPLGDPIDAGRWANAAYVVMQRNYAFTRTETQKHRIVTDEGRDRTEIDGSTDSGYVDSAYSRTSGQSDTRGRSNTEPHVRIEAGHQRTT